MNTPSVSSVRFNADQAHGGTYSSRFPTGHGSLLAGFGSPSISRHYSQSWWGGLHGPGPQLGVKAIPLTSLHAGPPSVHSRPGSSVFLTSPLSLTPAGIPTAVLWPSARWPLTVPCSPAVGNSCRKPYSQSLLNKLAPLTALAIRAGPHFCLYSNHPQLACPVGTRDLWSHFHTNLQQARPTGCPLSRATRGDTKLSCCQCHVAE